ncbi:GAF domain-containing protein [bacterium]|nr:GAF domain-containing protein [bacterium]
MTQDTRSDIAQRYQFVVDNVSDAVVLVDAPTGAVIEVNRTAEALYRQGRNVLVGRPFAELFPHEQREMASLRMQETRQYSYIDCDDLDALALPSAHVAIHLTGRLIRTGAQDVLLFTIRNIASHRALIGNLLATQNALIKNQIKLENRIRELSALTEVTTRILNTRDLDDILDVVLMAVTLGTMWAFNRAVICLHDPATDTLRGTAGMGPSDGTEAEELWPMLNPQAATLSELVATCHRSQMFAEARVNRLVATLAFPASEGNSPVQRAIREHQTVVVPDDACALPENAGLCEQFGVRSLAVTPLMSASSFYGVIIADNNVTRATILPEAVEQLEVFARQASMAIENAQLYRRLQRSIDDLSAANEELKLNRDKLLKAERLSTIGRVTAQVAHEIRNPLTAIGGFARNLARKLGRQEELGRLANIIVEEVDRLELLLTELLGYTRRSQPRWVETDLGEVARDVARMLHDELKSAGVSVALDLAGDLPPVTAQREHVEQVLINLLRNAKQAMDGAGGAISISSRAEQTAVQLTVSDTGPGMPQEVIDRLFEGFFTTKRDGSGLGLPISRQIMQEHGGDISVSSSPGAGAAFTLHFPRTAPTSIETASAHR